MTAITGDGGGRIHITLGPKAAVRARQLAQHEEITVPEVVRRALGLYGMWRDLAPGEQLLVRRVDGSLDRVVPSEDANGD